MMKFEHMKGPMLVAAYNAIATAQGKPLVKRFSNLQAGIKRCVELSGMDEFDETQLPAAPPTEAPPAATNEEGNTDMTTTAKKARKARTPKAAKPAKAKATKKAANGGKPKISATNGKLTNRQKLKNALTDQLGKKVSRSALVKAVYGSASEEHYGALNMSLRGLKMEIEAKTYPYKFTRSKNDEGEICYQLNNA